MDLHDQVKRYDYECSIEFDERVTLSDGRTGELLYIVYCKTEQALSQVMDALLQAIRDYENGVDLQTTAKASGHWRYGFFTSFLNVIELHLDDLCDEERILNDAMCGLHYVSRVFEIADGENIVMGRALYTMERFGGWYPEDRVLLWNPQNGKEIQK